MTLNSNTKIYGLKEGKLFLVIEASPPFAEDTPQTVCHALGAPNSRIAIVREPCDRLVGIAPGYAHSEDMS